MDMQCVVNSNSGNKMYLVTTANSVHSTSRIWEVYMYHDESGMGVVEAVVASK